MNKKKKVIVVIILILVLYVILFFSRDYLLRQYFISKLEDVDYDEYILSCKVNGKNAYISYYTENFCVARKYDGDELEDKVVVDDYTKCISYEYDLLDYNIKKRASYIERPINVNNYNLLCCLRNEVGKRSFTYKGIYIVNDKKCYVLDFKNIYNLEFVVYLDKELLYTVKEESYFPDKEATIIEYELDLKLEHKDLFETNIINNAKTGT